MKLTFALDNSLYDCRLEIADTFGTRYHLLCATADGEIAALTADINADAFDIRLIPVMPEARNLIDEMEATRFADKLAKKAASSVFSALEKFVLQVGCAYHVENVRDGDRLDIHLQAYAYDVNSLLDMTPVMYTFFELSASGRRLEPEKAFSVNRKAFLKTAKAISLATFLDWGLLGIITYPVERWRAKHLSKDKKIFKKLAQFHNMTEEKRQKYFEKL